jgi:threonine synthase
MEPLPPPSRFQFACTGCGLNVPSASPPYRCGKCGKALALALDVASLPGPLSPNAFRDRQRSLARYWEFLPFGDPADLVTLGEGGTPLQNCGRLASELHVTELYAKNEGTNPTGTFKDRSAALGVSRARQVRAPAAVIASDGNAGPATAAYCARAGLACYVVMPAYAYRERFAQARMFTEHTYAIEGDINDCISLAERLARANGWYHTTTAGVADAYQAEGPKTIAYEIFEEMGFRTPDWMVAPVGGGGLLASLWRAATEWVTLGWVADMPRFVAVQAEGCAPLVREFQRGGQGQALEPWKEIGTKAITIAVPEPLDAVPALRAIRETHGTAVAVSDAEIEHAQHLLASREGILAEPAGIASLAAVVRLCRDGRIAQGDSVVFLVTGSGLKELSALASALPLRHAISIEDAERSLGRAG